VKRFLPIVGILAALVWAAGCKKQTPTGPDTWAMVNGKEIKRAEVEKYYRSRVAPENQQPSREESLSLMMNILDELVTNEILLELAKKQNLEASDGEVEDRFTELKSPYTEEEFQRQMKERGVTVEDLKRDLRRELSIKKLINRDVVSKITITDQDVADFYNQNRAQFNVPEAQFRILQIVVTSRKDPQIRNRKSDDATTDAEARRKAAALLERLRGGADFAQLAMDYSEDSVTASTGGDLGYIPESALSQSDPALKKMVLTMTPGQVSNVIALRDSYRILKLVAREAAGQRELSDPQVQQSIRENLRNRKEQLLGAAYRTTLRDSAKVDNYLAKQVLESAGKLPEVTKTPAAAAQPAQQ